MPGVRIGELLLPLGWDGGKTILDDSLREIRPLSKAIRTTQRTIYRPDEICQFDVWEPKDEIPVGYGQTRRGYVVVACLGYSKGRRRRAGFSKQTPALLAGIRRCLCIWAGCPRRWSGIARPTSRLTMAGPPRSSRLVWPAGTSAGPQIRRPKASLSDGQGYAETSFEPGRVFANKLDFQNQLDDWATKVNAREHRTIRARPCDRLLEELQLVGSLPETIPDTDRRWVLRVALDPYVRFDTNNYSIDPDLTGRRIEIRVADREITAIALDTGELACRHPRSFARHRTIAALEHARAFKRRRVGNRESSELAHLFRQLKTPAAAAALTKLADRARGEEGSYEQFAGALLTTETDSRDSHGGQSRSKAARFPARKTIEEFDFAFQASLPKNTILHLAQLDFLAGKENIVLLGPPGTGKTRPRSP